MPLPVLEPARGWPRKEQGPPAGLRPGWKSRPRLPCCCWGQARQLYSEGKYQEALDNYRRSLTALPKSPNMEKRRRFLETSIADASVAVAQEYIKVGRYDEAVKLLEDALKATPGHALAKRTLEIARDPVRTNPALSPEHVKNVEEVNRLLRLAYGYYELGQYDAALKEFTSVLQTDPLQHGGAARHGAGQPRQNRLL